MRKYGCRSGNTYVITGGLGGVGISLAQWLVHKGARHLVLTSSRGLRMGLQRSAVERMQAAGVEV